MSTATAFPSRRRAFSIRDRFKGKTEAGPLGDFIFELDGPADISLALVAGKQYVIIPEHTSGSDMEPKDDQVTVVELVE